MMLAKAESAKQASLYAQATARLDGGANFGKEMPASVVSQSDANNGLAHHSKSAPSSTPLSMAEHLDPNSQMELVGHSIVLTPYSYGDPHYGGMLSPYGQQAMVPPPLYGMRFNGSGEGKHAVQWLSSWGHLHQMRSSTTI